MYTDIILTDRHMQDLNPLILGEEDCSPTHRFGPATRQYTLIHFIEEGRGTFLRDGVEHPVQRGQAFIIRPGEITTYWADPEEPWHYRWIGFDGALSARFAELPAVITAPTDWGKEMMTLARECDASVLEYALAARLQMMYAEYFADSHHKNDYVATVKSYVRALYMQPLRVEQIAANMSLDRRYLSRIFKERTGKSIQEFIVATRIEAAKGLLSEGYGVAETAHLCGYEDSPNFSKLFRRECGVSPIAWRKKR